MSAQVERLVRQTRDIRPRNGESFEPGRDASPAAEWEGVWRGVDGTVYLLECKYNMTAVCSALLCRL